MNRLLIIDLKYQTQGARRFGQRDNRDKEYTHKH